MYTHQTTIRVRYADTDQMGYVYYGKYLEYLEVARVEALRALGVSYASMEKEGIMLPVRHCEINYIKPIYYDQQIIVQVSIDTIPTKKVDFKYNICSLDNEQLTSASTILVFVDNVNKKPCLPPDAFLHLIKPYFDSSKS